jgi:hypothetical protein
MGFGTLFNQIRTAFTGDVTLSAALTDMNFVDVVNAPAFPYGTYHYVAGSGLITANHARLADRLIQFNIFDDASDMSALASAYDALLSVYDNLVVQSGGRAYEFLWEFDESYKVDEVWHIICRYRVSDHPA